MPRTELGPAISTKADWDYSGHVPVAKGERLDARFKNSISKPPPDRGDMPRFDQGRFQTTDMLYVAYVDYRLDDDGDGPTRLTAHDTCTGAAVPAVWEDASCGDYAKVTGVDSSYEYLTRKARTPINLVAATVAHNVPVLDFGRVLAAAIIMESKLPKAAKSLFRPYKIELPDGTEQIHYPLLVPHNGKLLKHVFREWFGSGYPWRWDQAAPCYLDIRIDARRATAPI